MSVERKFIDTPFASTTTFTAGISGWNADGFLPPGTTQLNSGWLSAIPSGTGQSNRVGSEVIADELNIRLSIVPLGTNTSINSILRLIIFADNECDGAYPSLADLYTYFGTTDPRNFFGFIELGYNRRFRVLRDKYITISNNNYYNGTNSVPEAPTATLWHEENIDLGRHRIEWDVTGGNNIQNARNGHVFIGAMWLSEAQSAGVISDSFLAPAHFHGVARLRFLDTNSV